MLTTPVTKNGAPHLLTSPAARQEEALRNAARKRAERVRAFKLHLVVFLVAMPLITGVWALTEYMNADGWPERFGESAGEGTWNPWILWVFLIWGAILAFDAVKTYFRREPTDAEIDREVARLKARR